MAAAVATRLLRSSVASPVRALVSTLRTIPSRFVRRSFCTKRSSQFTIKQLAARVSKLEKIYETRFLKLELRAKYLTGWGWGSSTVFAASIMALPAGIYYAHQDVTNLIEKVKDLKDKVDILEGSKSPTKVEVDVKFPQSG